MHYCLLDRSCNAIVFAQSGAVSVGRLFILSESQLLFCFSSLWYDCDDQIWAIFVAYYEVHIPFALEVN
jgi:hypothetical protein